MHIKSEMLCNIFKDNKIMKNPFPSFWAYRSISGVCCHTWVNAGATASAAVVLFSHNYLPPDTERKHLIQHSVGQRVV